jgi:putative transposase
MAQKRHSGEDILKLLREIELALAFGHDVATACRSVGMNRPGFVGGSNS